MTGYAAVDGREPAFRCAVAWKQIGSLEMSETKTQIGQIRTEVHGHVFKIIIDNVAKKNSFSPQMMAQMSDAMTLLDRTDDYWVGVLCAEDPGVSAGVGDRKFVGPTAQHTGGEPGNNEQSEQKNRIREHIAQAG